MKFELDDYNRNISDESLVEDLKVVAKNSIKIPLREKNMILTVNITAQPNFDGLEAGLTH